MSNGKACGPDSIPSELLKYSPDELASAVASVINSAVARGDNLSAIIGAGILVPLPKPNKAKGPVTSLRPKVLLNSIRKALSLIVLKRISGDVSRHLGYVRSGFRPGRSTADVVWTQRWLASKAIRYREEFHVLGLYMSKAFDTIDRTKLLQIMRSVTGPDEVCLIHHLLFETTLTIKDGSVLSECFDSTIGIPQGDGLSPVLFVCYLEAALQDCRSQLSPRPVGDNSIPQETG